MDIACSSKQSVGWHCPYCFTCGSISSTIYVGCLHNIYCAHSLQPGHCDVQVFGLDISFNNRTVYSIHTWGSPKVTRLFHYLKMRMKYKFFKWNCKFPEICFFCKISLSYLLLPLRYLIHFCLWEFAGGHKFW